MICVAEHDILRARQPLLTVSKKLGGVAGSSRGTIEEMTAPLAPLTDSAPSHTNLARIELQHFRTGEFESVTNLGVYEIKLRDGRVFQRVELLGCYHLK